MNLKDIEKRVNELNISTAQAIEEIQSNMDTTKTMLKAANNELLKAQESGDTKAYSKAANEQRTYKDVLNMYEQKMERVKGKPGISYEQYNELKGETIAAMDDLNSTAKDRIINAMAELEAVRDELSPELDHGMEMLKQIDLLYSPHAQPKVEYSYKGKDGGKLNIVTLIITVLENPVIKYIKENK